MIAKEYTDWLEIVRDIPESELPCNSSTVAYAVRVALLLTAELDELRACVEQLLAAEDLCDGGVTQ